MSVKDYGGLARGLGEEAEERVRDVASATGSVLAEVPGEFSTEFKSNIAVARQAIGVSMTPPIREHRLYS